MEITENKLCHFCMERKGTVMKIQLLCGQCEELDRRGENHKIVKNIEGDFIDRVKEDDLSSVIGPEKMIQMNERIIQEALRQKQMVEKKEDKPARGLMAQYQVGEAISPV